MQNKIYRNGNQEDYGKGNYERAGPVLADGPFPAKEHVIDGTYDGSYGLWQYPSKGSVSGISGRMDMDYVSIDCPSIIKKSGLNGYRERSVTMARTADALVCVMEP